MADSTGVCAGACCSVFPLRKDYKWLADPETDDQKFIVDMIVPLTRRQALRRSRRLGYEDPPKYGKSYGLYTCRHWNEETRLCGAYEDRPNLCRDYPYEGQGPCERGCGYCLSQDDADAIAARSDAGWVWDVTENGWRPRSHKDFLWDREAGVLRSIPGARP